MSKIFNKLLHKNVLYKVLSILPTKLQDDKLITQRKVRKKLPSPYFFDIMFIPLSIIQEMKRFYQIHIYFSNHGNTISSIRSNFKTSSTRFPSEKGISFGEGKPVT